MDAQQFFCGLQGSMDTRLGATVLDNETIEWLLNTCPET